MDVSIQFTGDKGGGILASLVASGILAASLLNADGSALSTGISIGDPVGLVENAPTGYSMPLLVDEYGTIQQDNRFLWSRFGSILIGDPNGVFANASYGAASLYLAQDTLQTVQINVNGGPTFWMTAIDGNFPQIILQWHGANTWVLASLDADRSLFIGQNTADWAIKIPVGNPKDVMIGGALKLSADNTVSASVATASTHKVKINVDGTDYFFLAHN